MNHPIRSVCVMQFEGGDVENLDCRLDSARAEMAETKLHIAAASFRMYVRADPRL